MIVEKLTSENALREDERMKATERRYTLRPQTPNMKPPVYALRFELPEPRKGMIRAALMDICVGVAAVAACLALMIDG